MFQSDIYIINYFYKLFNGIKKNKKITFTSYEKSYLSEPFACFRTYEKYQSRFHSNSIFNYIMN